MPILSRRVVSNWQIALFLLSGVRDGLDHALPSLGMVFGDEQVYKASCTKVCGPFETCILFNNDEYCAQNCAPGRCDVEKEVCILQGVPCDTMPCLPVAICESISTQGANAQGDDDTIDDDQSSPLCERECPRILAPVCGSNNVSYANECFFERAKCRAGDDAELTIVDYTLCARDVQRNELYRPLNDNTTKPSSPSTCDNITCANLDVPVCTTDGTMQNRCIWSKEACRQQTSAGTGDTVTMLRTGSCEESATDTSECPKTCSTINSDPVCASNGMIFGNDCLFRQARCARPYLIGGLTRQADLSFCE